jgi:hypothetical protein
VPKGDEAQAVVYSLDKRPKPHERMSLTKSSPPAEESSPPAEEFDVQRFQVRAHLVGGIVVGKTVVGTIMSY